MTRFGSILFLTAAAAWAAPALPQAIPSTFFVVVNNTSDDDMCAAKLPGSSWSAWFKIDRGANWTLHQSISAIKFQCAPPVKHKIYSLKPGKRYNLLREDDGAVALVEVAAGDSDETSR